MAELKQLIDISNKYGSNKDYVIAGGGNTSYKDDKYLYVKASGRNLSDITEEGFVKMDRSRLNGLLKKEYSSDPDIRENEVKVEMFSSRVDPESGLRPSVEAPLHNIIPYSFVVHTHATLVNGVMCSENAESTSYEIFGDDTLYIPYLDPGYILCKEVEIAIEKFEKSKGFSPKIIFLQNHGVFVGADTTEEIDSIYSDIENKLKAKVNSIPEETVFPAEPFMKEVMPAVRMKLSGDGLKTAKYIDNSFIRSFTKDRESYSKIDNSLIPDEIVYCRSSFMFIDNTESADEIVQELDNKLKAIEAAEGIFPKIIILKGKGIVVVDDSASMVEVVADTFRNKLEVTFYSASFGGLSPMTKEQVFFIDNWEVEKYRKGVASAISSQGKVQNMVAIVTGGAQGFGGGIVEYLYKEGANVVIADLNSDKGKAYADELNAKGLKNRAFFVETNVSDANSVQNMILETVACFGGVDVIISNAGILRAGGLDEMAPDTFELMTKVNYSGYFICTKYASEVMKIQNKYNPDFFMDIIQVNSKSGLRGSNKNFAYAGGKFGGLGLTQSFAMELMPYNIKVNSICPGNFFDGPLWSDPENGLFVQYLKAGKVPGAKTIADVKKFYEDQVPAKRGCTVEDVMKAIFYVIEQQYETGQAVPVTGGQIMLN
jgi:rhamnose utilization protein RhaD (predicted bifunctional aldolase and dehydrogenase)/NAD(P)-dependent dehydrogenase (short-subunit alcohol dehydrogenase family)